ncbi:MAG TPA: Ig-like domain-containing protein, partial [Pseudomonadales bacterium]|nr:Ig-like domain-containing protein [Pseudomonadales bacterium]
YWSTNNPAVIIDPFNPVLVNDIDSTNFDTGSLNFTVDGGVASENKLSVIAFGDITVSDSAVSYKGVQIGSIDTHLNGLYNASTNSDSALRINLNSSATPEAVSALIKATRYTYVGNDAISDIRDVVVSVSDGDGATSNVARVTMVGPPIYQYDEVYPSYAFEDTTLPFAAEEFGISSGDTVKITFIGSDRGQFKDGSGNVIAVGNTLTYAQFNALTFVPAEHDNGDGINSLSFKFVGSANTPGYDVNGLSLIEPTIIINLAPVNDAPTIDLNGTASGTNYSVAWTEAQGLANANTTVSLVPTRTTSLADVDDTTFASLTVNANVASGDRLMLGSTALDITQSGSANVTVAGVSYSVAITSDGSNARVLFTHTGSNENSVASYEALLDALAFNNLSEDPDTAARVFAIEVNDGDVASNVATTSVSLTATNDMIVVDKASNTVQYDWGLDIPVTLMPAATLQDVDGTVKTVTLSIADALSGDQLNFTNTASVTGVWDAANRTLTLTNTGTTLAMQSALRSVTFSTTANTNGVTYVDMVATDNDGLSTLTSTTTVKLMNNSPRIDLIASSDTGDSSVDDITSDTTPTFDIRVPDNAQNGDTLTLKDADGNTLGTASVNASDAGSTVQITATTLADGPYTLTVELDSTGATAEISIVVDNTNPTIAGQTFSYAENQNVGTVLGKATATDLNDVVSYSITAGDSNGYFAVDANGNISLTAAGAAEGVASNDYEAGLNSFALTVQATDAAGNTSTATVTLNVTNRDEYDPTISAQTFTYNEMQTFAGYAGSVIATDDIAVVSYTFKHSDGSYSAVSEDGYFRIDESGNILLTLAG